MAYPVTVNFERPEKLSQLTTFFRLFTVLPNLIVFAFVCIAAYVIYVLSWFAIIFTGNYPQSFFKFLTWWFRWSVRLGAYILLLTDKYPPFTGDAAVAYPARVEIETPGKLNQLTSFLRFPIAPSWSMDTLTGAWKLSWSAGTGFPMTLPHTIVLFFLGIAAGIILFLSWFAIVFTGRYPEAFYGYITWVFRWSTRVEGYAYLFTDKYPPFSGAEEA